MRRNAAADSILLSYGRAQPLVRIRKKLTPPQIHLLRLATAGQRGSRANDVLPSRSSIGADEHCHRHRDRRVRVDAESDKDYALTRYHRQPPGHTSWRACPEVDSVFLLPATD